MHSDTLLWNRSLLDRSDRGHVDVPRLIERRNVPRLKIYYSKGDDPRARVTKSESHGGFDNDPLTMNHILKRVLKTANQVPVSEFTKDNLDY